MGGRGGGGGGGRGGRNVSFILSKIVDNEKSAILMYLANHVGAELLYMYLRLFL